MYDLELLCQEHGGRREEPSANDIRSMNFARTTGAPKVMVTFLNDADAREHARTPTQCEEWRSNELYAAGLQSHEIDVYLVEGHIRR